jgi:hypothetical protein
MRLGWGVSAFGLGIAHLHSNRSADAFGKIRGRCAVILTERETIQILTNAFPSRLMCTAVRITLIVKARNIGRSLRTKCN